MVHSKKVLSNLAWHLSAERTFAVPLLVAVIIVALSIRPFNDDWPWMAWWGVMFAGAFILGFLLCHPYAPIAGKNILRAIEKEYGPKTSMAVYQIFADLKEGERRGIDIDELAKSLGEG